VSKFLIIESIILLIKLLYSQARIEEAVKLLNNKPLQPIIAEHLVKIKQSKRPVKIKTDSLRQLQLFCDLHSIRGLCLGKKLSTLLLNNNESNESKQIEQDIIDSFELTSVLIIEHSMNQQANSIAGSNTNIQTTSPNQPNSSGVSNLAGIVASASNLPVNQTAVTSPQTSPSTGLTTITTTVTPTSNENNNDGLINSNSSPLIPDSSIPFSASLNTLNNRDDAFIDTINPLYEIALLNVPVLYVKRGDFETGIKKFRDILVNENIHSIASIKQTLLKKFAECLFFKIPPNKYMKLKGSKPKMYMPNNMSEETLLCLTLSQYLASKEVTLLRQKKYQQVRENTLNNAVSSLDLLLIFLTYRRSFTVLLDKFDSTMKYSFEQFYIWYQYGLTLICDEKYQKAYLILKECIRMKPDSITCYLLLAKLAIENLFIVNEAIDWCHKALEITKNTSLKAFILLGCSFCIKAKQKNQYVAQIGFYEKALDSFKKASSLEPSNYLPLYHIAHCYSILRQVNESLNYVQRALKYKPDDKDSLHLLVLLLTSTKNYDEAYTVIAKACTLYDDLELLYTKIRVEELLFGFSQSILSLYQLILFYKKKIQMPYENDNATSSSMTVITTGGGSTSAGAPAAAGTNRSGIFINQNLDNWSSFESASLLNLQNTYKLNESIGKTITMLVQSDQLSLKYAVGNSSSLSSSAEINQNNNIHQLLILMRILTQIGEFYLRHQKLSDAEACCQEMASFHPLSYLHIYLV
jgi:tetratricopeptide (TPR) repeat protein